MLPNIGVEAPSEIQLSAIPEISKGTTLAIQSFTGSGKVRTLATPCSSPGHVPFWCRGKCVRRRRSRSCFRS